MGLIIQSKEILVIFIILVGDIFLLAMAAKF